VAFTSGIAGSADPTSDIIAYSLGTNTTGFSTNDDVNPIPYTLDPGPWSLDPKP